MSFTSSDSNNIPFLFSLACSPVLKICTRCIFYQPIRLAAFLS